MDESVVGREAPAGASSGQRAAAAGRAAYAAGEMRVPVMNATVNELTAGLPVGGGAADIFRAFLGGFDEAADEAAERVLRAHGIGGEAPSGGEADALDTLAEEYGDAEAWHDRSPTRDGFLRWMAEQVAAARAELSQRERTGPLFGIGDGENLADGTQVCTVAERFRQPVDDDGQPCGLAPPPRRLGRIWHVPGYGWVAAPARLDDRPDSWSAEVERAHRFLASERDACLFLHGYLAGVGRVRFEQAMAAMPWSNGPAEEPT